MRTFLLILLVPAVATAASATVILDAVRPGDDARYHVKVTLKELGSSAVVVDENVLLRDHLAGGSLSYEPAGVVFPTAVVTSFGFGYSGTTFETTVGPSALPLRLSLDPLSWLFTSNPTTGNPNVAALPFGDETRSIGGEKVDIFGGGSIEFFGTSLPFDLDTTRLCASIHPHIGCAATQGGFPAFGTATMRATSTEEIEWVKGYPQLVQPRADGISLFEWSNVGGSGVDVDLEVRSVSAEGIIFTPEPNTALLTAFGLVALARRACARFSPPRPVSHPTSQS